MNILHDLKIKWIYSKIKNNPKYINGTVFNKNIGDKRMNNSWKNPRIIWFSWAL